MDIADLTPHHLAAGREHVEGNRSAGRFFFLPGSDGRARRIGERFDDLRVIESDRAHNVYLGSLSSGGVDIEVGAVATGMGCPTLDIIVTELIALGARRFLRVGTAGSLQPDIVRAGHFVVATGAVRDESISDTYVTRGYPAMADPDMVEASCRAARSRGVEEKTYRGVVHSKDALFTREFGLGARPEHNSSYMEHLRRMPVLASEMEAAHLFILADTYSRRKAAPLSAPAASGDLIKSGTLLAVVGDDRPFAPQQIVEETELAAIDIALDTALELFALEWDEPCLRRAD
jgi:uridine phosphorylase